MLKRNKLFSKAGFYFYNMLAFITNGNKHFVDKKLIFGALLIGISSQYGCKTKDQINKSLENSNERINVNNNSDKKEYQDSIQTININMCYKAVTPQKMEVDIDSNDLIMIVDGLPEFPGGEEKRIKFIKENLKYPKTAKDSNIQGTVFVTFLVEKDGSISNIDILRGINKECDDEALRVIKLLPKWKPGQQRGKPQRVQFNMPIKFTLDTIKK